jgi:predicted ribosomally synthesized peptide with SipW-like signal peptide
MPKTSAHREQGGRSRTLSVRVRAALSLGVVLGFGTVGTLAAWTDDVAITGSNFTAGTLNLQVNNADAYATTTLGMTGMVPGNTSAEILTVRNAGTVPLKYTLTGGLTGTDAASYNSTAALTLNIKTGATRSGTGNSATCTGGTSIYNAALTSTTTTAIIGTGRQINASGTEALCFQVTFAANAANSLQGDTATASFTASGTSDLS